MPNNSLSIIILGAGKGTRMKSDLPKVMHKIAGKAMVNWAIDLAKKLQAEEISLVISKEMQQFREEIHNQYQKTNIKFCTQKQQIGTADAVKSALSSFSKISDNILILYADTPLIKESTLKMMIKNLNQNDNAISVLGFDCFKENKYGRLIVKEDSSNQIEKIVEFKDASKLEQKITLCNSGVMAIKGEYIKKLLDKINNKNAAGEYYLTDAIAIAKAQNLQCSFIKTNEDEVMGVNSRNELAKAEKIKQNEIRQEMIAQGVSLIDPDSVYFSFDTKIASDVTIAPQNIFGTNVEIEANVEIKPFCHIEGVKIKKGAKIGPFARIRPDSVIGENAKIGNFVEVKKSKIKDQVNISHLSYIGDSEIDSNANIGAGTITCNYDGYQKNQTKIGKKAFIGSNSCLIAPVKIGDNAIIGAGSVISKNVAKDDLATSRAKQTNISNGGKNYHSKKNSKK